MTKKKAKEASNADLLRMLINRVYYWGYKDRDPNKTQVKEMRILIDEIYRRMGVTMTETDFEMIMKG